MTNYAKPSGDTYTKLAKAMGVNMPLARVPAEDQAEKIERLASSIENIIQDNLVYCECEACEDVDFDAHVIELSKKIIGALLGDSSSRAEMIADSPELGVGASQLAARVAAMSIAEYGEFRKTMGMNA